MPPAHVPASRSPLLHPIAVTALVLLAVNDHVLKAAWPGLVTGKLSDVAALLVVPPLAVALAIIVRRGRLTPRGRSIVAIAAAIAVAVWFAAVKLHPVANEAYAIVMGLVQWPAVALRDVLEGLPIVSPARAPTVLDPGDLIALPAAALGWWVAAGRAPGPAITWPRGPSSAAVGRAAVLLATLFTLAATSQAMPSEVIGVVHDEVLVGPAEAPVHRRLEVGVVADIGYDVGGTAKPVSIVIEARARWPRVEPAARFVVSRIREDGRLEPSTTSIQSLPRERCARSCTIAVDVAIDWPADSGRAPTSVAWELVATIRSPDGGSIIGAVTFSGDRLRTTAGAGSEAWFAYLAVLPLVAIAVGVGLRPRVAGRRRRIRAAVEAAVAGSVTVLAVALAVLPFVVPPASLEPAAGGMAYSLVYVGPTLAIAIVSGLVRWWRGAGEWLAIVLVGGALALLLFGARLAGAASETFLIQGQWVASVATILVGVAVAGAVAGRSQQDVTKPIRKAVRPLASSRLLVAAIQVALVVGLATVHWPTAAFLAGALSVWWSGSGALLGLVSTALAAGFAAMLFFDGSLLLSGPRWMPIEAVTLGLAVLASVIGMLAAFGGIGRYPGGGVPDEAPVPRPIPID